jgi:hypothetical protein
MKILFAGWLWGWKCDVLSGAGELVRLSMLWCFRVARMRRMLLEGRMWRRVRFWWKEIGLLSARRMWIGPAGGRQNDLGDTTLMPGMIDAHVHLFRIRGGGSADGAGECAGENAGCGWRGEG